MTASILIVDDQLELLAFTGAFLAECGYTVSWARNAAEAMASLSPEEPRVLRCNFLKAIAPSTFC